MFAPVKCQGYGPRVCKTGPLSTGASCPCERGLITGHQPDRDVCESQVI